MDPLIPIYTIQYPKRTELIPEMPMRRKHEYFEICEHLSTTNLIIFIT